MVQNANKCPMHYLQWKVGSRPRLQITQGESKVVYFLGKKTSTEPPTNVMTAV